MLATEVGVICEQALLAEGLILVGKVILAILDAYIGESWFIKKVYYVKA